MFERLGTISGVLKGMHDMGMQIGVRIASGPDRGRLVWRRPNQTTIRNILTHPLYAGAYVYGRRGRQKHATGHGARFWKPAAQWLVLLRDRMPSYITWDQHEANLRQIQENRSRQQSKGAIRQGRALLCGLVVCSRCGYRMTPRYAGAASTPGAAPPRRVQRRVQHGRFDSPSAPDGTARPQTHYLFAGAQECIDQTGDLIATFESTETAELATALRRTNGSDRFN